MAPQHPLANATTGSDVESSAKFQGRTLTAPAREWDLAIVIYLTIIVCSILYPRSFFSSSNALPLLNNLAADGIIALGMMLLMIGGLFDLSVGATMSLTGVVCGQLMVQQHWPIPLAVLASLALACLVGLANGWLVAKAKVNALIVTLGTMGVLKGASLLIGGTGISNLPVQFSRWGQGTLGWAQPAADPNIQQPGIQYPVLLLLALALLFHYLLAHTRIFRQFYFIGSNPKAARLSGMNVSGLQILGFVLSALLAGIAGLAYAAKVRTAQTNVGDGMELRAISAVIMGGASLTGGKGSIPGALLGVLFMALISDVLVIVRFPSYWQGIALGVILILAVAIDSLPSRGTAR